MHQLYILFEHASGFAIFRTTEFEEVAVFLPQVRESILNISKFRSNVFFVTFQSFQNVKEALDSMKTNNAGNLSHDLQLFLENNIPRSKKNKQRIVLGVEDPDLATAISDKLGIYCISTGLVMEVIRGIRLHFYKLVKGFTDEDTSTTSQLSLAHHYARAKLNFDATRQDSMIVESTALIDSLEKDIRTAGKRIRACYAFHFPELYKLMPHDIELYIQCVNVIGNRKKPPKNIIEDLTSLLKDSSKVEAVLGAAHNSMGTEISPTDLENLKMLCERAISLMNRREETVEYLKTKMQHNAPCVSSLIGEVVGSKLISRAGGLEKLAKLTSSSVQVLGAEKKFFRTLKDKKEKIPIIGILSGSRLMSKAAKKRKGGVARILANNCSLAAKIDYFSKSGKQAGLYSKILLQKVEDGIKNKNKVMQLKELP